MYYICICKTCTRILFKQKVKQKNIGKNAKSVDVSPWRQNILLRNMRVYTTYYSKDK